MNLSASSSDSSRLGTMGKYWKSQRPVIQPYCFIEVMWKHLKFALHTWKFVSFPYHSFKFRSICFFVYLSFWISFCLFNYFDQQVGSSNLFSVSRFAKWIIRSKPQFNPGRSEYILWVLVILSNFYTFMVLLSVFFTMDSRHHSYSSHSPKCFLVIFNETRILNRNYGSIKFRHI